MRAFKNYICIMVEIHISVYECAYFLPITVKIMRYLIDVSEEKHYIS